MLEELLRGIVEEPHADDHWLVLADWLEEHDDPLRAELLRLQRRLIATCCQPGEHPERDAWQARMVVLLRRGVRPCVPQKTLLLGRGVELRLSWIPPGAFLMGSSREEERPAYSNDEPQHRVTVSRGIWLSVYPVTQAQWKAVMDVNVSRFKANNRPVERVTWDDSRNFGTRLREVLGLPFRLPTEAEWEYACRAGTTTPFFWGPTLSTDLANFHGAFPYGQGPQGAYHDKTTVVGSYPPNAWGLYDMHGNVWEWCLDGYGPYPGGDRLDPREAGERDTRVLRGGCWRAHGVACRSAARCHWTPSDRSGLSGFRICLEG